MMAIKRKVRLVTKVLESSGPIEVPCAAVKKHVDHDQFFCRLNDYIFCYPDQKIVQFIPGNDEFTVELYKKDFGKPYSKIDLFLCNVSNEDDATDCKVPEDKKVNIERSCIETSNIQPSNIVALLFPSTEATIQRCSYERLF